MLKHTYNFTTLITYLRVGGVIYYDAGDNGATYKFYGENKNELSSYSDAYYYSVSGTPTKNRYYVYATNNDGTIKTSDTDLYWTYYNGSWVYEDLNISND